ncbi:uncharacterized protein M6B38_166265 [Iris pallida]|uniref:Uncharacterized protein n=1 Tax=Iris pallida TaxID=29817 RepID=A0AAX6EYB5_IRIPA|nr:uncharacterized protein M6B38_166265 [Iris pallida]
MSMSIWLNPTSPGRTHPWISKTVPAREQCPTSSSLRKTCSSKPTYTIARYTTRDTSTT